MPPPGLQQRAIIPIESSVPSEALDPPFPPASPIPVPPNFVGGAPPSSPHVNQPPAVGWTVLKFLVLLHLVPLLYWLYAVVKSWRLSRARPPSPKIRLQDVRNLRQLRRMM
ncbi:hypothetical protein SpCBS45565_g03119 [Spizellomyces sp. 'palustris']|nr:hypothetical protein SpCBS45565_g03119 [Spizellomyces sp. 'palustris']